MSNFASLVFYFVTFGIAIVAFSYYKDKNITIAKIGLTVAVLIPTFVAGFRYMVGTDYDVYYYTFRTDLPNSSYSWILTDSRHLNMERVFLVISKFITSILGAKGTFGFFAFIIVLLFIFTLIKQYKRINIVLPFFLFLMGPYMASYNILRQSIALIIAFWGCQFVFEGNIKKYFYTVICASCFHFSAILSLPIYLLWNHRKKTDLNALKKLLLLIIAICFVLTWRPLLMWFGTLTQISSITKYTRYLSAENTFNRSFYLKLFWGILFFLFKKRYINCDRRFALFINMYVIGVILEYTGFYTPYIKRISNYYSLYTEVMLIGTFPMIFRIKTNRNIVRICTIFYEYALFFVVSFLMKQGKYFPYRIG